MNTEETKNLSPAGSAQAAPQPADIEELEKVAGGVKVFFYHCTNCGLDFPSIQNYGRLTNCIACGKKTAERK